MNIIAIGWIYVVLMMSITEQSAVAGVVTFLLYGVLPVSIILYLGGSRGRKHKRQVAEATARQVSTSTLDANIKSVPNQSAPDQSESTSATQTEPK